MSTTLSESASKALLAPFGVPFALERIVRTAEAAADAGDELGYPVVAKLCGDAIAHKTERGLVRLRLNDRAAVSGAAQSLLDAATPADGPVEVLVSPMLAGDRELIVGLHHDDQFGMTAVVGIGGVLAEALGDVSIRLVPLVRSDALQMIDDLQTQALLGPFRGQPAVDREAIADVVLALVAATDAHPEIVSVDLNPLIVVDGAPIAVDALVEVTS